MAWWSPAEPCLTYSPSWCWSLHLDPCPSPSLAHSLLAAFTLPDTPNPFKYWRVLPEDPSLTHLFCEPLSSLRIIVSFPYWDLFYKKTLLTVWDLLIVLRTSEQSTLVRPCVAREGWAEMVRGSPTSVRGRGWIEDEKHDGVPRSHPEGQACCQMPKDMPGREWWVRPGLLVQGENRLMIAQPLKASVEQNGVGSAWHQFIHINVKKK